jgi:hypothetical protein
MAGTRPPLRVERTRHGPSHRVHGTTPATLSGDAGIWTDAFHWTSTTRPGASELAAQRTRPIVSRRPHGPESGLPGGRTPTGARWPTGHNRTRPSASFARCTCPNPPERLRGREEGGPTVACVVVQGVPVSAPYRGVEGQVLRVFADATNQSRRIVSGARVRLTVSPRPHRPGKVASPPGGRPTGPPAREGGLPTRRTPNRTTGPGRWPPHQEDAQPDHRDQRGATEPGSTCCSGGGSNPSHRVPTATSAREAAALAGGWRTDHRPGKRLP